MVWQARTSPYGEILKLGTNTIPNPIRLPGQYEDSESGLYYNRFRYYSPQDGGYINRDPIGLLGGDNLYDYPRDPLGWVDPFGLQKDCGLGGGWKPKDINNSKNWNGCEQFARDTQAKIGGDIYTIKPNSSLPGNPTMGKYRGVNTGWYHHDVVVKDGIVFDAFGPKNGVPADEYKKLFEYYDVIDFGF